MTARYSHIALPLMCSPFNIQCLFVKHIIASQFLCTVQLLSSNFRIFSRLEIRINKTQYFRLRLYWLLFWCSECFWLLFDRSLSALWLLSECSLSAHLLRTYSWVIAWRFEPEWWRLTALDKFEPNIRTNERRLAFLELLSEPKILKKMFDSFNCIQQCISMSERQ